MRSGFYSLVTLAVVVYWSALLAAQSVQVIETRADASVLLGHRQIAFAVAPAPAHAVTIVVDPAIRLQRMDGFGASLTDSSAALLLSMPADQRGKLMQELFDPAGPLGLTFLRQPIGASDFSAHGDYSYDDASRPDPSLERFSAGEDDKTVFPLLRQALHLNPQLKIMALPWSAPAWMKGSHTMHAGSLQEANLPVYARYLARTVQAYGSQGLPIFALALQNEPLNENPSYPTQHMDPAQEARLALALRPLLWANGRDPILMGYEHNWNNLDYPAKLLDEAARIAPAGSPPLFTGISFHCYAGDESAQIAFLRTHPAAAIWFTECSGTNRTMFADDLLWQAHHLLLGAPLNGARSVLFWNLLLNPHGGPHNGGCSDCRALLTVEEHGDAWSVQRNVEYYELAHAAPFVHPGAVHIGTTSGAGHEVQTVAFQNPDGTVALLVLNPAPRETTLTVQWQGKTAVYTAPARSLLTFSWGTPTPVLADGTYRISPDKSTSRCLEAAAGAASPALQSCGDSPGQRWSLHRLGQERFEIRNVATGQSIGVSPARQLTTLTVGGDRVAPLLLHRAAEGLCIEPVQRSAPCSEAPAGATNLQAGDWIQLIVP